MKQDDRLRVTLVAAAVGAAVGATAPRSHRPAPAERPGPHPTAARPTGDQPAGDQPAGGEATGAAAPRGGPRTITLEVPKLANGVSLMAVGALITLLVLWATGTLAAPAGTAEPAARPDPDLPVTAADLAAQQAAAAGAAADGEAQPTGEATPAPAPTATQTPGGDLRTEQPGGAQAADPGYIEIPAIGVAADVIPLGLDPTGALEVPTDFSQTGWWTGGPEPGEPGPAVVVGHVDSFRGPAVFFALRDLRYDDLIRITRTDGSAATFAVRSTVEVDKDEFPTDLVYGDTGDTPALRLITCDGDFADGSYLGNLIVFAELIAEEPAPTTGLVS